MPNSSPSPRRAPTNARGTGPRSGAGRPAGGRAGAGRSSRDGGARGTGGRPSSERRYDDRPSRGYGNASGAPRRGRDDERGGRPSSGAPRREFRDSRDNRDGRDFRGPRESRDFRDGRDFRAGGTARPSRPRRYEDEGDDRRGRPSASLRGESPSRRPSARPTPRGAQPTRGRGPAAERPSGRPLPPSKTRNPNARTGRAPRPVSEAELAKQRADATGRAKGWGGVARKGGVHLNSSGQDMASTPTSGWTPDPLGEWVEEVKTSAPKSASKEKAKAPYVLPGDVAAEIRKAFIGTAYMREKMVHTLTKAAEGYDRKRYEEALRLGREVADAVPGVAPVRELTGLAAYKAERWNMAKIHLRALFALTDDPEHLPLVMDCDRAMRRFRAVAKTYDELVAAEPSPDTLTEARIVMGSALADQHKYAEAIDLLVRAGGTKMYKNPPYRQVRLWYALADVFDRSGDHLSARELFARVVVAEPDAYDAQARLAELGASAPRKNRKRRTAPVSKKKVD